MSVFASGGEFGVKRKQAEKKKTFEEERALMQRFLATRDLRDLPNDYLMDMAAHCSNQAIALRAASLMVEKHYENRDQRIQMTIMERALDIMGADSSITKEQAIIQAAQEVPQ